MLFFSGEINKVPVCSLRLRRDKFTRVGSQVAGDDQ